MKKGAQTPKRKYKLELTVSPARPPPVLAAPSLESKQAALAGVAEHEMQQRLEQDLLLDADADFERELAAAADAVTVAGIKRQKLSAAPALGWPAAESHTTFSAYLEEEMSRRGGGGERSDIMSEWDLALQHDQASHMAALQASQASQGAADLSQAATQLLPEPASSPPYQACSSAFAPLAAFSGISPSWT